MDIKLIRERSSANATLGQMFVDGQFECWTLEDVVLPVKVFGETAIPAGSFQVVISMSNRFKTRLPLLVDVPGFTGVRIHPGNTKADTLGCILVGQSKGVDAIGASRAAFAALMPKLERAAASEKIKLLIVDAGGTAEARPTRGRRKAAPPAVEPAMSAAAKPMAAKGTSAKRAAKTVVKKAAKKAAGKVTTKAASNKAPSGA